MANAITATVKEAEKENGAKWQNEMAKATKRKLAFSTCSAVIQQQRRQQQQ